MNQLVEAALGATAQQLNAAISPAAVVGALPAALAGVRLALETNHLLDPGQTLIPPRYGK